MAINKKLIHFETLTKFQSADGINTTSATQSADANLLVGNIPYHSIVFIKDVCKFWTHGKYYDCNNTWRGIQNNLTSTSTTDSLSAYQGKILNEKFANYLPLSGGTLTGALTVPSLTVTGASTFSQAINGSILGNAATASRLLNARNIAISGAVTGNANFDGSGNITISTSVNHSHSYVNTIGKSGSTITWSINGTAQTALDFSTTFAPYDANGYLPLSNTSEKIINFTVGSQDLMLTINRVSGGSYSMIKYTVGGVIQGFLGFISQNTPVFRNSSGTNYTLYHTGNLPAYPVVTNYYWANVKIKSTSDSATSPTFNIVTASTGNITDATIGNLVVTGGASFAQTINGNAATANKVNHTLTFTGYSTGTFDGSADKSIAIPSNTNQLTNGAGFITASSNITGTAAGITGYTFKSGITNTANSGWTNTSTDDKIIPTMNFIAYWNGAYNSGGSSNLTYCCKGAFGTATTHAHTDYVTSISYDSTNRKLQLSKGGGTATDIVTFGSHAFDSTAYLPTSGGTLSNNVPNILTLKRTDSGGGAFIDYYHAGQTTHYWRAGSNQTGVFTFYYDGSTETLAFTDSAISYKLNTIYHTGNLSIGTLMGSTAIGDSDEPVYWSGTAFVKAGAYPTKASWNYDDVYLKLSGGTLFNNSNSYPLQIKGDNTDAGIMYYQKDGTQYGFIGINKTNGPIYWTSANGSKNIWHLGNLTTTAAADGGTTAALVTTGDKYKWNLVYDWLTTTTADTDTTINKWKELEAFLTSITESDTLTGLLALYLPLSGGKMSGPIEFERSGTSFSILQWSSSYPNYGIWYYNSDVDKMALSASGNANSTNGADLCINGNGDGTVTIRGNTIIHTGNYSSYVYSKTTSDGRYVYKSGDTMTGSLTTPSLTVTGAATFSLAINGSILGNAATASRLLNARNIAISGAVTGNANFDGSGNITISTSVNHTHSYAGSSSAGGAATNVVVNSGNNSASTYPLVWHSGNTLYSTSDVYVNPSTDVIYNKGVETTGRVKAKSGNNMVQLIPDSDCGLYMTSSGQWLHIAGSGSNMYIYNGTWDSPGAGNYNKGIIIDTSNNIGIGTTSPSYKLHVSGGLLAITNNSNTVTIGSQNTSWCHIESGKQFYMSNSVWVNGTLGVYNRGNCNYYINNATSVLNDLRVSGADLYIGSASGSQCHQQYDSTNKILKFIFD